MITPLSTTGLRINPLSAVLFVLLSGCGSDRTTELSRSEIEWERNVWGLTGRSIVKCPAGDCLLLHYAPTEKWLSLRLIPTPEQFDLLLKTPENCKADRCQILPPGERWGGAEIDEATLSTFNCCSYALGDVLDLGPGDWIDTTEHPETGSAAPFQTALDSFFDSVTTFQTTRSAPDDLESSVLLHDGDLICFVLNHGLWRETIHVGIVRRKCDRNWIESKMGMGPIVLSTARQMASCYVGLFDEVDVYRQRKRL